MHGFETHGGERPPGYRSKPLDKKESCNQVELPRLGFEMQKAPLIGWSCDTTTEFRGHR